MSDGKKLAGQQFNPRGAGVVIPYIEQMVDYDKTNDGSVQLTGSENVVATEITPVDAASAKVRTYDLAAIAAIYEAVVFSVPGKTTVPLPNVLTSVTATFNKTHGDGQSLFPVTQQGAASAGSGSSSVSPHATAQSSAAIIADVEYEITNYRDILVDCQHYYFYLTGVSTMAAALTKVAALAGATVTSLPIFKTRTHQITAKGMQVSLQANASTSATVSASEAASSWSYEWGNGYSKEVGVSTKVVTIPETIHGTITIASPTDSDTATVTVKADSLALYINATPIVPAITNSPAAITMTANGSVSPASLSATSPASIPTSGLYLADVNGSIDDYGFVLIHATVVDFAQYA
jgi:hypothetical protein